MSRLYLLARRDLSGNQPYVQAMHAVAAWCHNESCRTHWDGREVTRPRWRWNNDTLVVLGVQDESELTVWYEKLKRPDPDWKFSGLVQAGAVAFHEPYFNNQMTALACLGERETFQGLSLL